MARGVWNAGIGLALFVALLAASGCVRDDQSFTPARRTAVEASVHKFVLQVAQDLIEEGPMVWRKHFADSPSFFMVVNGHLEFAGSEQATQGIREAAQKFPNIMLHWGDDLRVDALTPEFAVVGVSYHEVLTDREGHKVNADGYFTGLAELRDGRWQFRNAHWSMPVPVPKGS